MLLAVESTVVAAPAGPLILYLAAALTVAALAYLTYAMIRPERF